MLGVHVLIGLGEAIITVAALAFIEQTRPDLLNAEKAAAQGGSGWAIAGVLFTALALVLSPFASTDPDGLERVATDLGFLKQGVSAPYKIIPDYTVPFIGDTALSTIVAGLVGALVVLGLILLIARSLRKK
jgi:cobalt/nickel transport system permease protein